MPTITAPAPAVASAPATDPAARRRRLRAALVGAVCVAASAAASAAGAAPSGRPALDRVLVVGAVALLTVAGAHARRSALAWLAALALLTSVPAPVPTLAAATAGFALAVRGAFGVRRSPVVGAVVAAIAGNVLLRVPGVSPHGATLAIGLAAALPCLVSAHRAATPRTRRVVVSALAAGGTVLLVVGVLAVLGVRAAGRDARVGAELARRAIDAALAGDADRARLLFERADTRFEDAAAGLDRWSLAPARAVPLLAQQLRALDGLVDAGGTLSAAGARAALVGDLSRVAVEDGRVDLAAVEAIRPALLDARRTARAVQSDLAGLDSPWLLTPIGRELDALDALLAVTGQNSKTAVKAFPPPPGLLGDPVPRRYLVLFLNTAEARPSGGIVGSYAEITAVAGNLEMTRFGRATPDLNLGGDPSTRTLRGPDDYVTRYGPYDVEHVWQDLTLSPDWPSVAQVAADLYPQSGGAPVDGVIGIDPFGIAALLRLTGPIAVPGLAVALDADNAARILLRDQYELVPDRNERTELLEAASRALVERITNGSLPGARELVRTLGPAVDAGHVKLWAARPDEQAFFAAHGLDGAFPPLDGDFVAVTSTNASASKIDSFLRRRVEVAVDLGRGGAVTSRVTATLVNDAPPSGLSPYVLGGRRAGLGVNRMRVALYSPLALASATVDGEPVPVTSETELGRNVFTTLVEVPPGGQTEVVWQLTGTVAVEPYELTVARQPLVVPDEIHVRVARDGEIVARIDDPQAPSSISLVADE